MSNLPQTSQTTVPNISTTSAPNVMLTAAQVKKKKEDFLIFTRVLVVYLEQKDPGALVKVKAIIKDCADRNKHQEPGYESLTASLQSRLKAVVSDAYWKRAEAYLDHFLARRQNTASVSVSPQYDGGFQSSKMSLHLLFHAAKCPHVSNCPDMRFCRDTRMLWLHMGSCNYSGAICVYPHCSKAKALLAHFEQRRWCTCKLCLPVRIEMGIDVKMTPDRMLQILKELEDSHKCSWIFKNLVDPVALNLPDDFQEIEIPMDLGTVRRMLEQKQIASKDEFVSLVNHTFDNAMTCCEEGTTVHNIAKELKSTFAQQMGST